MTTIELAAVIAGYSMALFRVANSARWGWSFLPAWAQVLLPALVTALPAFASQLGGVTTKLELTEAIVVFLGALGTAWRGSLPNKPKDPPTGGIGIRDVVIEGNTASGTSVRGVIVGAFALCLSCSKVPAASPDEALALSQAACRAYVALPTELHNEVDDRACQTVMRICLVPAEPPAELHAEPPALGNRIVTDVDAGQ